MTDHRTPHAVAEHLATLPGVAEPPTPVRVTIGRTSYEGAFYAQARSIPRGCPAYERGERVNLTRALYLLGELPSSYRNHKANAYALTSADGALAGPYYVAAYATAETASDPDHRSFHPFGAWFSLCPDDYGVIGLGDRIMAATVETLPVSSQDRAERDGINLAEPDHDGRER